MTIPLGEGVQSKLSNKKGDQMTTFKIKDLHCKSCIANIKDGILEKDDKAQVTGNLENAEISVNSTLGENELRKIINKVGFEIFE